MYGISFIPQSVFPGNSPSFGAGARPRPVHQPTPPTDDDFRSYVDLEVAHIVQGNDRLRPKHPFWDSISVNLISRRHGMNALAAAIIGRNARLIRELLNCPHIDVNKLLPLDRERTPKQAREQFQKKPELLSSLPVIRNQRYYTVLDLFNAMVTRPADWEWIRNFNFPVDEVRSRTTQNQKQAIEELIQTLKDQGAKSAAEIIPGPASALF